MRLWSVTVKAGVSSTLPSTLTRPSAIQRSAPRREHRPARASLLAIRSGPFIETSSLRRCRPQEGAEEFRVALGDHELGMPLHADAEAIARRLDALDHAVGRGGVHDHAGWLIGRGLVMGAVHLQFVGADDAVQ